MRLVDESEAFTGRYLSNKGEGRCYSGEYGRDEEVENFIWQEFRIVTIVARESRLLAVYHRISGILLWFRESRRCNPVGEYRFLSA